MPTKSSKKKPATKPKTTKTKKAPSVPAPRPPQRPKPVKRTYLFAVGRRKSAVARVRFEAGSDESLVVNELPLERYFPQRELQLLAIRPLETIGRSLTGRFSIRTHGGGKRGQAEAIRLGIARVLILQDPSLRPSVKHAGHLTRDPRVKERKKYGLKRARRAPQWQKR